MDANCTLSELKDLVRQFCEDRDWDQYHNPKELAVGIITEAAELLEQFRFLNDDQMAELLADANRKRNVEDELADVLFFVLRFSQRFDIELSEAVQRKIEANSLKYPVEKSKGRNLKYTDL